MSRRGRNVRGRSESGEEEGRARASSRASLRRATAGSEQPAHICLRHHSATPPPPESSASMQRTSDSPPIVVSSVLQQSLKKGPPLPQRSWAVSTVMTSTLEEPNPASTLRISSDCNMLANRAARTTDGINLRMPWILS